MKVNKITTYIALGTNLGNRQKNLKEAIVELNKFGKIIQKSHIYETEPIGYKDQGSFLNMVVKFKTGISPFSLLKKLKKIEKKFGREKTIRNGPRIIDLDILFYSTKIIKTNVLEIPHPRLHQRDFVLIPLSEIAPNKIHPILRKKISTLKLWTKNA